MDLLRPPAGWRLDFAVLTTYTLDLETLLALPFAVIAHSDGGVDKLLEDPLLVLQGLREAGDRLHVFVDETGIAVPRRQRELYATLEDSVHPVRASGGGVFHPKVWLARFVHTEEEDETLLRVAVLSRNLTFDRSWDIALASEAKPARRRFAASRALGELIADLVGLCTMPPSRGLTARLRGLAADVRRCAFPPPEGFSNMPIAFHAMGLDGSRRWRPKIPNGRNVLAVAPFVRANVLDTIRDLGWEKGWLISRGEELDGVSEASLYRWDERKVLADSVSDETDDDATSRPSGLHAKIVGVEHGWDVTWFVGSANLTPSALQGRNVEVMAEVTGRRSRVGISQFLDGFDGLCESYRRSDEQEGDQSDDDAGQRLDCALKAIVEANLEISCTPSGDLWEWRLEGCVAAPQGVDAYVWPVSLTEDQARQLDLPVALAMPVSRLTAFVAFRLTVDGEEGDERRIALKLPMAGAPGDRSAEILRSLIDTPERLLAFLRALLGALDELGELGDERGIETGGEPWREGFEAETLLEDLMRTASKDPQRLATVRRLISDLRRSKEGRDIVPDRLLTVWRAVEAALDGTET